MAIMFRALRRIHERVAVRKFENSDERAWRLAPIKKVRFRIIAFAFSLASAVTGLLFMTERTADHQLYLGVTWAAFASASIGAQLLVWSKRAGPAIDNVFIVKGMPEHRPAFWGPVPGTIAALTLSVLGVLLIAGFAAATFWTAWSALKSPAPVEPTATAADPVTPKTSPTPTLGPLAASVTGKDIVDGDTFDLGATRIRPFGYDTPEEGKHCEGPAGPVNVYNAATEALSAFVVDKIVTCADTGKRDRDGRTIATCAVGSEDLGAHMVGTGWGRDWPSYSEGKYCQAEKTARANRLGIWGLSCPSDVWNDRDYKNGKTGKAC